VTETDRAPLVSVVINNYNYDRFLADAVESALGQTHPRVEVIVVDDGSTDGSRETLARWDGRIRTVLKENGGQASALNAGWSMARGELVLLLDADDILLPDTAARAARAARVGSAARAGPAARDAEGVVGSPGAVWSATAVVRYPVELVDAEQRPLGRTLPADALEAGDLAAPTLAGHRCPAPPTSGTALVRSLADPLFPIPEDEWRISADAYIGLLAPLMGDVAVLDAPGALYRLHGQNRWVASGSMALDRVHDQLRIDRQRESALRRVAGGDTAPGRTRSAGLTVPPDWLLRDPEHLQFRLASLRLDPASHPEPGDRRARLAIRGLRAALRTPAYRLRKRVLFAVWFLVVALLPRSAAVAVIEMGLRVRERPWIPLMKAPR
jgi:hypothetical protein